jgi:hypothetical protein
MKDSSWLALFVEQSTLVRRNPWKDRTVFIIASEMPTSCAFALRWRKFDLLGIHRTRLLRPGPVQTPEFLRLGHSPEESMADNQDPSRMVNGVNQTGKQIAPEQLQSNIARQKKRPVVDALINILTAFAKIVSPIKDTTPKGPPRR